MSGWKRVKIAVPLLLFALFVGWAYFNWFRYDKIAPLHLIPDDAVLITETHRPLSSWENLMKSPFWQHLSSHPDLAEITAKAEGMNQWIRENKRVSRYFGDHQLIFSLHMTSAKDYDFLFAFDLERASSLSIDRLPLGSLLNDSFRLERSDFREHRIVSIHGGEEPIHLCQIKNFLLLSYRMELIHAGIERSMQETNIDPRLELAYARIDRDRFVQCIVNYDRLPFLAQVYLKEIGGLEQLGDQMAYAALDLDLKPERLSVDGFSSLDPERASYARLLQHYGRGQLRAQEVLSSRVAYLQSIHVDDAQGFYQELMRLREQDREGLKDYAELKQQIEGVLDLSLEEHILSWLGDELVLAELGGPTGEQRKPGKLIAIKARDRKSAERALQQIQEEIIHRTPARFSSFTYKGYTVHYLDWKSFFRLILGPSQRAMTRPYYTMIGDYVVFSDRPETLIQNLEDMENGHVLAADSDFKKFLRDAGKNYSSLTYLNTHQIYPVLSARVRPDQQQALLENMDDFSYLDHWSLVVEPDAQGYEHRMEITYAQSPPSWPEESSMDSLYRLFKVPNSTSWLGRWKQPEQELSSKMYTRFYPDGTTMLQLERKDHLPHGDYREFHPGGQLRCKGSYRKGTKRGTWEWYAENGSLIRKR